MEKMVLEQYLKVLFPEVKSSVKEHNPKRAEEAAELVDAHVTAHKGPGIYHYGGQLRPLEGKSEGFGKGGGSSNYNAGQASSRKPLFVDSSNQKAR